MKRLQISHNFYLDEFTRSQTAARHDIDMSVTPCSEVYRNLKLLAELALQPAREALGPIFISSGYRPLLLNQKIGGSDTSAHVHGLAADIAVSGHSPLEVARWFESSGIAFDQVIHEYGQWVHVGIAPEGEVPRQQLLTAVKTAKGTAYLYGIHSMPEALRRAG